MAARATPKASSKTFKVEWERLVALLDPARLVLICEGCLDKKSASDIIHRSLKGSAPPTRDLSRAELVGALAQAFVDNRDLAHGLVKALDKRCIKERSIVASIDADALGDRLDAYQALHFRRERSRMLWALARDGRAAATEQAERLLGALVAKTAELAAATSDGDDEAAAAQVKELAHTVDAQADALQRQLHTTAKQQGTQVALERRLEGLQQALANEVDRRVAAEQSAAQASDQVNRLSARLQAADEDRVQELAAERDQLKQRSERLQSRLAHAEDAATLKAHIEELEGLLEEQARTIQRLEQDGETLRSTLMRERDRAEQKSAAFREALGAARRLNRAHQNATDQSARVAVFVDGANLAASARRDHGQHFDFVDYLQALQAKARVTKAVLFLVEGADSAFGTFLTALREAGWDVRTKKKKTRADGSVKADWDVALTLEVVDARQRAQRFILASGDGDFVPLLNKLTAWGKDTEVHAFAAATDPALKKTAGRFVDLSGRHVQGR